ncbi:MAG: hypothetical protein J7513_11445 [Solirubrobacteraceae bacterium]|nr:hypothetical protein [Solirubrobacteraceae bacterium]
MTSKRSRKRYSSTIYQFQHPDWEPLLGLVGQDLAGWFMWMGELRLSDGTSVHGYKHRETRRYLHLAPDGRAYEYLAPASFNDPNPERYREWSRVDAIDEAFLDWSRFHEGDPEFAAQRTLLAEVREVAEAGARMPVDAEHLRRQLRFDAAVAAARLHERDADPGFSEARLGAEGDTYVGDLADADTWIDDRPAA